VTQAKADRPLTILIAALGGEGGGVLTNWLVNAANREGYPIQATSIPGVAQRTGATTYYLELWPAKREHLGGREPVMSLAPVAGELDLLVSSEMLETGRAIQRGLVTPDRTTLIASSHRVLTTREKMAMGDGAYDSGALHQAAKDAAAALHLCDMAKAAQSAGAHVNAVMLGAIAGAGLLPLDEAALTAGIEAEGKAVEANLRGFRAGLALIRDGDPAQGKTAEAHDALAAFPPGVKDIAALATARLTDYQDRRYAQLYAERLEPLRAADPVLLQTVARHLAVRMSYEDIIRVAQLKLRPGRYARIREETGAKAGEVVRVTEFFKPGIAEFCDILPSWLARRLLARAERNPKFGARKWAMELKSTRIGGHLRLKALAGLRRFRRRTWRYKQEQASIEAWLADIAAAAKIEPAYAVEIAECARLIKGYGGTHQRGSRNFARIRDTLIAPVLARKSPPDAASVAAARDAALADPEGLKLSELLAR
jgi:indolepyruvate ferredoxin oxidoreductase beta subunit